jgi:ABC-type uncharacterized transport system permease subunit
MDSGNPNRAHPITKGRIASLLSFLAVLALALAAFGLVLLLAGKDPIRAYADVFSFTFTNAYGFSEVIVRMTPLLLTAVAVAIPAGLYLINVGGEGQLHMGAWLATWTALTFKDLPAAVLLPLMMLAGMSGGGLWAVLPGVMRAKGWVNETISTLLLNYVAPLVVSFSIFGPWRSAESAAYPQTPAFVDAARLPSFGNTRIHLGLFIGLVMLVLYWFLMARTRWGLEIRAIGGNVEAARRLGVPLQRYIVVTLLMGGAMAGLAGMAEVSAIQGRLRQGISPGFGFMGFLISWLAGGDPLKIIIMCFLVAVITSGGDILQITQGVPFSVINILMALILSVVLARPTVKRQSQ